MKKIGCILLSGWLCMAPSMVYAQTTRYVSDQLEIPMRAGASERFKVLRMIESGSAVQVMQVDKSTGYTLIKSNNTQGWVLTRYLMDSPSARSFVDSARASFEPLKQENDSLKAQLNEAKVALQQKETDIVQLAEGKQHLAEELAKIKETSAQALAIDAQNKTLNEKVSELSHRLQVAEQQNRSLQDNDHARQWMIGGSMVFGGILFGWMIIPRLRPRKNKHWDGF